MRGVLSIVLLLAFQAQAAQEVTSDDGRQVQLNKDGSWVYTSTDRFATTPDGRRVRLSDDGQWSYTGEKSAQGQKIAIDQKYIAEQSLDIVLTDLVIETTRGKKSASHKNSRKKTRTVFYITLSLDKNAGAELSLPLKTSDFTVEDTDGRDYPVLQLSQEALAIKPGNEAVVAVYADGSPHWWTTKSMSVKLNKALFSSSKTITLSRALSDAKKKDVEGFE